ncbi:MAG: mechanosensitive ion channel [Candidatus Marinimicrobia bacterium]|nr:mechanosensitive ion channel [Candidatus Neomarinimicrobiota bacterium]
MPKFDSQTLVNLFHIWKTWFIDNVFIIQNLVQLFIIFILLGASILISRQVRPLFLDKTKNIPPSQQLFTNFLNALVEQVTATHLTVLLGISSLIYSEFGTTPILINLVLTLLVVWITIKLVTSVVLDHFWALTVSIAAWIIAALSILDVLEPMLNFLDQMGFTFGTIRITILSMVKAGLFLLVALRAGSWFSKYLSKQIGKIPGLTPSASVLISKTVSGVVYFSIGVVVLNSIGVNFTALTVFGGALGVGIGFGLQKVASNLLSGIILLSDHSIKPGDVIQIGNVYGWVTRMKARYISVDTRDGHEHLIPNEDLITQQVINWSYSNTRIRLKIPFGVAYSSDPHQVAKLVLQAIKGMPRIIKTPPPLCLLTGFGDSSIDFALSIWIRDPKNGIGNIKSEVLFKIWDTLKSNNIEIPFPQHDIHIKHAAGDQ